METYLAYYTSEIGVIEVVGTGQGILSVSFAAEEKPQASDCPPCLEACIAQLDEYFQGKRQEFDLPLIVHGTEFRKQVWRQLTTIPFGATATYQQIANAIGKPKACRAVGNANHQNKHVILIPCHRVIGRDGKLVGYGGGLWRKEWLLQHERGKHSELQWRLH